MRKIISILITLGLVLGLVVIAAPASASSGLSFVEVSLGATDGATAEWSTTKVYSGSYSVHLKTTGIVGTGKEARIVIPVAAGTTLGDIDSLSWWVYAVAGYPPHVDITLDCDGDGVVDAEDMLTAEMNLNNIHGVVPISSLTPGYNKWLQTFEESTGDGFGAITDSTELWVTKMGAGNLDAPSSTLGHWKAGTVDTDPFNEMTTCPISSTTPVVKLEIEVDNWVVQSEAYVDLLSINPVYDLEPTVGPNCACENAEYTILFITTASLTEGFNSITIAFPDGTTVPGTFEDGDITINGMDVFGSEVTVVDTTVTFLVPEDVDPGVVTQVTFTVDAGIKNPCTPGTYNLYVNTSRAPDATPVKSPDYDIVPALHVLDFHFDFDPTYDGIAEDFIPPFKACGQEDFGEYQEGVGWMTIFDLILRADPEGCAPPCEEADMWFVLTKCPEGEEVYFMFDVGGGEAEVFILDEDDVGDVQDLIDDLDLTADPWVDIEWMNYIHFSSPGEYELCFYLECPAVPCEAGAKIVAEECLPATAHQWKDAGKIVLDEKWNLISLPLVPFDEDIEALLESLDPEALDGDGVADLISIWHYDRCLDVPEDDKWSMYEGGGLTKLTPDNSYWVRMSYPMGSYNWWVWGTARAMPPAAPLAYDMCPGWNMFGYTELFNSLFQTYLWNLDGTANEPLVYGWDNTGNWKTSTWLIRNTGNLLFTGQGYWGYFLSAGQIVPP